MMNKRLAFILLLYRCIKDENQNHSESKLCTAPLRVCRVIIEIYSGYSELCSLWFIKDASVSYERAKMIVKGEVRTASCCCSCCRGLLRMRA
jgi:GTP cyclohydrolase I